MYAYQDCVDVRQPLKCKKKICKRNGTECIVQCKYERLGDFCFVCGHVTHTERFCSMKSSLKVWEGVREWGTWLRAPVRRMVGQDHSKFLREDRDIDWDANHGNSNVNQHFSGDSGNQEIHRGVQGRNNNYSLSNKALIKGISSNNMDKALLAEKFKKQGGPTDEELIGFNIEEWNKRRGGPDENVFMNVEGDNQEATSETGLSNLDFPVSSATSLAKLAKQASRSQ